MGLLDADVHGPSIPLLMGLTAAGPPKLDAAGKMLPHSAHSVACASMGFLLKRAPPAPLPRFSLACQPASRLLPIAKRPSDGRFLRHCASISTAASSPLLTGKGLCVRRGRSGSLARAYGHGRT